MKPNTCMRALHAAAVPAERGGEEGGMFRFACGPGCRLRSGTKVQLAVYCMHTYVYMYLPVAMERVGRAIRIIGVCSLSLSLCAHTSNLCVYMHVKWMTRR